jgi:hypothetical protein
MQGLDFQDRLVHTCHKALFRYWWSRRTAGDPPLEQRFDLTETGTLAAFIGIVEVTRKESRLRFRHRYSGTEIVRHAGRDVTGLWFEEAYTGEDLRRSHVDYVEVAALRGPALSQKALPLPDGSNLIYDRLLLPLVGEERLIEAIVHLPVFLGCNGSPVTAPASGSEIRPTQHARKAQTAKA